MSNSYCNNTKCPLSNRCWLPYGEHECKSRLTDYQQGRADREAEIVTIIEQMKESASAMMWTEREVACEKILEQIREQNG